jgi:hypothetical protein
MEMSVQLHSLAALPLGRDSPGIYRLGGPQNRSGRDDEE